MLESVLYIKFPLRLIIVIIFFRSGLPKICKKIMIKIKLLKILNIIIYL